LLIRAILQHRNSMSHNKYLQFIIVVLVISFWGCTKAHQDSRVGNDKLGAATRYLAARDSFIYRLQEVQKRKGVVSDSLLDAERIALFQLELKLKDMLNESRFESIGHNNLETLLGFLGFGLMDGMSFRKDSSLQIFYTNKDLFLAYVGNKDSEISLAKIPPDSLAKIFMNAFHADAFVSNFSSVDLGNEDGAQAFGLVGSVSQIEGPFTPQFLYVAVVKGKYVYMAELELLKSIEEIPKCRLIWDNAEKERTTNMTVMEKVFSQYCECYRSELKNTPQFESLKQQMQSIRAYLVGSNSK
jgi:hypothetical protein